MQRLQCDDACAISVLLSALLSHFFATSRWRWLPWGDHYGSGGIANGSAADSGAINGSSATVSPGGTGAEGAEAQEAAKRQAEAEAEAALLRAVGVVRACSWCMS